MSTFSLAFFACIHFQFEGLTHVARKAFEMNLRSFERLVALNLLMYSPRHCGSDRDEWFFGTARSKQPEMNMLQWLIVFPTAVLVMMWSQAPEDVRGYALWQTNSSNVARSYGIFSSFCFDLFLCLFSIGNQ